MHSMRLDEMPEPNESVFAGQAWQYPEGEAGAAPGKYCESTAKGTTQIFPPTQLFSYNPPPLQWRGDSMSGRSVRLYRRRVLDLIVLALFGLCHPRLTFAQERREREPNSVYSARRAKLASQV